MNEQYPHLVEPEYDEPDHGGDRTHLKNASSADAWILSGGGAPCWGIVHMMVLDWIAPGVAVRNTLIAYIENPKP